ncbi:hypothetical protein NECAME_01720 [Necator americanus]|uniref:Uncharacterized protein n=1 Tax=Necator americanus TaxID=51031 RepID=W2TSD7_NECAM|nr:hypothetical protein NECAME_01720 [Necator americanus]ETN83927.1 hypothetical protein NECAME_01720 [Necator americanus]
MAICTYNARTLASEAAIEDLMMQAKKIKYDVTGLTETRRRHPLNAVYETGEELFLGTCDSRGVGGVGVIVNTSMAKNIDSFEQLTTRIRHSAVDNIDDEYDRPVEHLQDCAKKAENFKTTKRRLSLETLELIRQRGAVRATGNQELTSELAKLCREAIKEDLKERRAEVLAEAAEAGKSIRYARRDFASEWFGRPVLDPHWAQTIMQATAPLQYKMVLYPQRRQSPK